MIFFRKETVIYLKRQGLEIYSSGKKPLAVNFPTSLVSAEEIKDKNKLQVQLANFLTANKLTKLQVVMVLAEELIYQKNISATNPKDIDAEKEKFFAEIPFPAEKIVSKTFPARKVFLAVNGELFNILINVIAENGGKTLFVVPIILLDIPAVNSDNYYKILHSKSRFKQLNFLNTQIIKKNNSLQLLLAVIFVIAVLSLGAWLYYSQVMVKNSVKESINKTSAQKTQVVETATESGKLNTSLVSQKQKKNLTIKVLNGTGTAGDAKKVQDALETLDFQNITTDNIEAQDAINSIISYASSAASYVPEIKKTLQGIFDLEPETVATENISVDLQIITGK